MSREAGYKKISTKAKIDYLRIKIEGDELTLNKEKATLKSLEAQLKVLNDKN